MLSLMITSSKNPKRQVDNALIPVTASTSFQLISGTRVFACIGDSDPSITRKHSNNTQDWLLWKLAALGNVRLRHINLLGCSLLSPNGFYSLSKCKNLQDVCLSRCAGVTLSEDGLVSLVHALPQLRQWILGDTPIFSENMLKEMGKNERLEGVSLSLLKPAEPKLPNPAQSRKSTLHKTDEIERSAVTSADHTAGIAALLRPSLRTLRLCGLGGLADESFDCIPQAAKQILNHAPQTVNLNSHRSTLVGDSKMPSFPRSTYALSNLAINDCPRITDKVLEKIASLSQLTCLNLSRCGTLTDAGMKFITEGTFIGHLTELYLSHCSQITDSGIGNILKRAHNLAYLGVDGCTKLSDISLSNIRLCHKLTWMNFAGTQCADAALEMQVAALNPSDYGLYDTSNQLRSEVPLTVFVTF
ncbi:unnamed protein product [Schistocephalus solidus]|uniref:F-box/LRR-repeat protein 20 n=1 Tax=Schistocephalus solidus TaxID=70667 RepID=A0A183SKS6_SCHSO|nr:unnamed protein product [Schistocephalus solidus]